MEKSDIFVRLKKYSIYLDDKIEEMKRQKRPFDYYQFALNGLYTAVPELKDKRDE